jgi:hypothetical protein
MGPFLIVMGRKRRDGEEMTAKVVVVSGRAKLRLLSTIGAKSCKY